MCMGCGACKYICTNDSIQLYNFVNEGIRPVVNTEKCSQCGDCVNVCCGINLKHDVKQWSEEVIVELTEGWGPIIELWEGYAIDKKIRFAGSSGGVMTALALYAMEHRGMHGTLHVRMDPSRPYLNQIVLSKNRKELQECSGSRYAPAAVCSELKTIEEAPGPCVLLGKPCDIASARLAANIRPKLKQNLGLTISLFCGGTPSTRGTLEILKYLDIDAENIADFRYRGHGWPGNTGASLKGNGPERVEMTYYQAWAEFLTQHTPLRCKMCPDGTGEFADLSCGDPWFRPKEERKNEEGKTLIMVRTLYGKKILQNAIKANYIFAEPLTPDIFPQAQWGLSRRRRSVWPKLAAQVVLGLPRPHFTNFSLLQQWWGMGVKRRVISLYRAMGYMIHVRMNPWKPGHEEIQCSDPIVNEINNRN